MAMVILTIAVSSAAASNGDVAIEGRSCRVVKFDHRSVWSKRQLESLIISELRANKREFGALDWKCMVQAFNNPEKSATALRLLNSGPEGADVYRFTLDRSRNPVADALSLGPGNSNGVFTATFEEHPSGNVFVVRRGGGKELVLPEEGQTRASFRLRGAMKVRASVRHDQVDTANTGVAC
ncbi:hypothetical protein FGK63_14755 [Ruegeria sediminis]|uniref:Uncharacterized protein n=1 Tax=Ruegeria sediminis TaxID=2583820 RepID=A0ABY2WUZ6_9RHOB|nr:hypothetical protein [Ruegeria sediminis]TMV06408.1 hypothetical protein FGK63_14755 [Ruegeria sediminis]